MTSIGQDLLNDDSYVELVKYNIENSSTIKLDSFPTSTAKTGSELYNLIVGAIKDPVTGFTNHALTLFSLVARRRRPDQFDSQIRFHYL